MSVEKNSIKYSVFSYCFKFGFKPLFLEQFCFILLRFFYSDILQGLQKYLVIAKKNRIRNIKGLFCLVAPESVVSVVGVVGVIVEP